ncbi:MAG: hypothetical protein WBQ95_17690, partial [Terracidiphilus sp.]
VEEREAKARNLVSFKHSDNSAMLSAIAEYWAAAANMAQAAIEPLAASEAWATEPLEVLSAGD